MNGDQTRVTRFKTTSDDVTEIELRLQPENDIAVPLATFDDPEQAKMVMSVLESMAAAMSPRPKVNLELYQGDCMLAAFDQTTEEEEARGHVT